MSILSFRKWERLQSWVVTRLWGFALWVGVLVGVVGTANMASGGPSSLTISASPTDIVWTSNEWVTLSVSNLTDGAAVNLELYLDVQENGLVDGSDLLVASYRVQDGQANALGSSVIVDDEDGEANGIVVSRIAYFGDDGRKRVVGNYLWRARPVSGGLSAIAQFSVTQPISDVWITGSVIDYWSSNAVSSAVITLECFTKTVTPAVWTGTNGMFMMYLPSGLTTADVKAVTAKGFGYFNPSYDEDEGRMIASYEFPDDFEVGETPLPVALRIVSKDPSGVYEVSGHVYDSETNALAGVMVRVEWNDGEDGEKAITDSNGVYRLCLTEAADASVYPDPESLVHLGLVAVGQPLVVTNDVAGVDLYCPQATLLARGSVLAADNGEPVVGAMVSLGGDMFGSQGLSMADGTYEVGVIPYTNYSAEVDDDNIEPLGFINAPDLQGVSIMDNSVTNLDFQLERGCPVSGVVYDSHTNRVSGGMIGAFSYPSDRKFWEWDVNTWVNRHGDYRLLATTGELVLAVAGVPGCVGVVYANYLYPDWDNNHIADPVTNTVGGVDGIDFYLTRMSRIEGQVRDDEGTPMQGVFVRAEQLEGYNWQMSGDASTDENGFYSIEVPPGSNYGVSVAMPENVGFFWLSQYYDHVFDRSDAQPVAAYGDTPTTNINFDLEQGGIISGWVVQDNGGVPIEDCGVRAETLDGSVGADGRTDATGYFEIVVPSGTYLVEARPEWEDLPFGRQYFSNVLFSADAQSLSVDKLGVVSNVNFRLNQGNTISGHIYRAADMTPLANCHVFVSDFDSNDWIAGTDTDDAGAYTFRVTPGTYRVRASPAQNGLLYESKFYSNTFSYGEASPVVVSESGNAEGVDFTLNAAGTISGYVSAWEGGAPLGNCQVVAENSTNGEWMGWCDTEADGSYTLVVPEGFYRVVARPSNNGMPYVDTYYLNTPQRDDASEVWVGGTNNTPDINFDLMAPSHFEGRLTDKTTGLPVSGMTVQAFFIPDTNNFWNGWSWYNGQPTDNNGYYSIPVPSGDQYIIYVYSGDSFYPSVCWSNSINFMEAPLLAIGSATTVSNIDFSLELGGRITGHVYREDGGAPLGGCNIYAADGSWGIGGQTDSSGYYSITVPAGQSYRVGANPSNTGLPYVDEFYNDVLEWGLAEEVPVSVTNGTGGIDFTLMVSDLSSNTWKSHYFSMEELEDPAIGTDDADPDNDGFSNQEEYAADTDPWRSNSVLRVTSNRRVGGGVSLGWQGGRWARQYVQRCEALNATSPVWTDIYTNDTLPTVVTNFVLDADAAHPALFYRIKVER